MGRRVLIVEDDPEIGELLEFNLEKSGYDTRRAQTGLSACQQIGREQPDLILLDLMLPDFDGSEICKMIRAHTDRAISGIPIIMLTAMASEADRVRGLSLGAEDYVVKPFSIDELLLRIGKQLEKRSENDTARLSNIERMESQAVQEFQDMVFHELTNQMLIVRGYSDRLVRHGEILPQEKMRSYAQAIYKSSAHLGALAEEMLVLRRLKKHKTEMVRQEVNLSSLAEDLSSVIKPLAEEKGITLQIDIPGVFPLLYCNAPSLKIVFSSLLENAVKYGRPGGKILFAAAVLSNGGIAVYVEDDGIGIPESDLDRIFEKFQRGANINNQRHGTGLGLYFARTLTEALGGTITVSSVLGQGSRFKIILPAEIAVRPAGQVKSASNL